MAVGWIGFAGGVVGAVISALVAIRQSRTEERLARLNHELDAEVHRRTTIIDHELRAEDVLARYREPLAAAAFDLQSRLYNILRLDFFAKFDDGHPRAGDALERRSSAWHSISPGQRPAPRQFLSFAEDDQTRHGLPVVTEQKRTLRRNVR